MCSLRYLNGERFLHFQLRQDTVLVAQGEPGFALVEQIRYIDKSRCKRQIGQVLDFDLKQVEDKLKQLLFPMMFEVGSSRC